MQFIYVLYLELLSSMNYESDIDIRVNKVHGPVFDVEEVNPVSIPTCSSC